MDGSNYNPRRDDPQHEVKTGDDPRLILLVALLFVAFCMFLHIYRQQVLTVADCLIGTSRGCNVLLHPPEKRPFQE